jgi:hypothetical protein
MFARFASRLPGVGAVALAVTAIGFSDTGSAALVAVTQRDSTETLTFADQTAFSDALVSTSTLLSLSGNVGDSRTFGYIVPHGSSFGASVGQNYSLSAPSIAAGTPNDTVTFTVTALNGSPDTLNLSGTLGVNIAPSGADVELNTGASGGYSYLEGKYNPLANQTVGSPFNFTLVINGNYAAVGTTTGSHTLLAISPAWTIDQNFVFNGIDTVFSAHIASYATTNQIGLDYQLFGAAVAAPVPEPGTFAMVAAGLLLTLCAARRSLSA